MYSAPPCGGPNSVHITRRVFTVITGGYTLTVGPTDIEATLGAPNGLFVTTDSTTTGVIRDITIAIDLWSEIEPVLPLDNTQILAYGWGLSALLSGTITVNNTPFPTVIPIGSAIKSLGGIRGFWSTQIADAYFISPTLETTHDSAPAPIEIALPQASNFQVIMTVPSRAVDQNGAWEPYDFTGLVAILLEEQTQLGSVPGA
jgi:hypothetical protein